MQPNVAIVEMPSVPSPKLENHSNLAQTSSEDQTKCDVFDMTMVFFIPIEIKLISRVV